MAKETKPSFLKKWANTGTKTTPADAKIEEGWIVEKPSLNFFNWVLNRIDQMLAYLNQQGIPEWDNATEYQNGSSYVQRSGSVYKCIQTGTNKDPATQPTYWTLAFDDADTSYTKAEADSRFLNSSDNLSDLASAATARTNLSVYSKAESDSNFLDAASNLSDLASASTARTNLSVYSKAESDSTFAPIAGNSGQTFNVATPTTGNHATTKDYVDSATSSAGIIKQVKYAESTTNTGTMLSLDVIPVSTSNKFKVHVVAFLDNSGGATQYTSYFVKQNGTQITLGQGGGSVGGGGAQRDSTGALVVVTPLSGTNTFTVVLNEGTGTAASGAPHTIVVEEFVP